MTAVATLLAVAFTSATFASAYSISPLTYHTASFNHTCQLQPKVKACFNTTTVQDSCCSAAVSLTLVTSFWNTWTGLESQGQLLPANAWTAHGLWPDFCDGSYPSYCDANRQYDPSPSPNKTDDGTFLPAFTGGDIISPTLAYYGKYDLLDWMNKNWVSQGSENYVFWQHEFSKHATCFSVFDLQCYGPTYAQGQDIVDFLETAVGYQIQYPSYKWLEMAGITPSNTTSYTLDQIRSALQKGSGAIPYVGCSGNRTSDGRTVLTELWYFNYAIGRVQDIQYEPVDATKFGNSSCSPTAPIWYYERTPGSVAA